MRQGRTYQECLAVLYQLLSVNQFLLIFVKTLEEQKTFSIRDKWVSPFIHGITVQTVLALLCYTNTL